MTETQARHSDSFWRWTFVLLQGELCPIEQPSGKRHRERAGRRLTQSISTRHRKGTVSVNPARLVRQRKEGTGRLRFLTKEEYDALRKVIAKRFPEHVATSENQPLISRGWIQPKSFILLVPGGGVEPPRPCDRRILSSPYRENKGLTT